MSEEELPSLSSFELEKIITAATRKIIEESDAELSIPETKNLVEDIKKSTVEILPDHNIFVDFNREE